MKTNEFELSLEDCKNYYRFCQSQSNFKKSNKKTVCNYFVIMCGIVFLLSICFFFQEIFRLLQQENLSFTDIAQIETIQTFFLYVIKNFGDLFLIIIVCTLILFLQFKYDIFSIHSKNIFSIIKDRGNKITIYLTETEIKIDYAKAEIKYSFEQIQNVYKTDKYIFFFVGERTGVFVPLSSFNSDEHANDFFAELKKHVAITKD